MGISKPFNSANPEMNELAQWVVRNFATKDDVSRVIIRENKRGERLEVGELRYETYQGQERLLIRIGNNKYIVNLS